MRRRSCWGLGGLLLLVLVGCSSSGSSAKPPSGEGTTGNGTLLYVLAADVNSGAPDQLEVFRNGTLVWHFAFPAPASALASPSAAPLPLLHSRSAATMSLAHPLRLQVVQGTAYLGTADTVYAFNGTTGQVLWKQPAGPMLYSLTVDQGMVYVSSAGVVSAFAATDGQLRWHTSVASGGLLTPVLVAAGVVYVFGGSGPVVLTALDTQTGQMLWSIGNDQVNYDGVAWLYSTGTGGSALALAVIGGVSVIAYAARDGQIRWQIPESLDILGLIQGQLYALNGVNSASPSEALRIYQLSDGTLLRTIPLSAGSTLSYLTPDAQMLYLVGGPSGGDVSAWQTGNGSQRWQEPGSDTSHALVADTQAVYTASAQGITAWRAADGMKLWQKSSATNLIQLQEAPGLLYGVNQQRHTIVALTPATGKEAWTVQIGLIDSYVLAA